MKVPAGLGTYRYDDVLDMMSRDLITKDEARQACLLLLNLRIMWTTDEEVSRDD